MGGLHSLTLHGNPWQCDCHLRALIDWLVVANLPMVDLPRCKAPKRLEGQRFADIALDNFACSPELLTSPRYIEANVGKSFSVPKRVFCTIHQKATNCMFKCLKSKVLFKHSNFSNSQDFRL